jgi:hypothetical protein
MREFYLKKQKQKNISIIFENYGNLSIIIITSNIFFCLVNPVFSGTLFSYIDTLGQSYFSVGQSSIGTAILQQANVLTLRQQLQVQEQINQIVNIGHDEIIRRNNLLEQK